MMTSYDIIGQVRDSIKSSKILIVKIGHVMQAWLKTHAYPVSSLTSVPH